MTAAQVVELSRDLLYTALLLALPALGVSLVVGLVISIFQTVTSIQEQTLTFVPRVVAVGLVQLLLLPWSLQVAISFTVRMLSHMAEVGQ